jgi:hypothetical protein
MEFTAKDATILTLLTAQPSTRFFARLVEKLQDPKAKNVAEKIRQRAAAGAEAQPNQEPAAARQ